MKIRYILFICLFVFACKGDPEIALDNTVNIRLEGEPSQLNPILSTAATAKQVEWQIFMSLLQYDAETLELYPVLASSRPVVENITEGIYQGGRKYNFQIRPEAEWDDGQAVVAADFVFTLKTFMHPEIDRSGFGSFLSFIKKIEIDTDDPKRFVMFTNRSFNLTEEIVGTMAVLPKHIYDPENVLSSYDLEDFSDRKKMTTLVKDNPSLSDFAESFKTSGQVGAVEKIKGCGPYQIEEWLQGQRIVLKKKENWWAKKTDQKGAAFSQDPEQLTYHFIESDVTLSSLFKEQKIDVSSAIDPLVFERYKNNDLMQKHFDFYTPSSPSYYFISFNTKDPKLEAQVTRRAIGHLVDVEEAIKIAMNGYGVRTVGPILPSKNYYNQDLKLLDFNIEKAKKMLASAGWEDQNKDGVLEKEIDGTRIDFSITYKYTSNNSVAEKVGLLLKNNAIKAGVSIELIPLERNKFLEDTRKRSFDLYFSRWSQMPGLDDMNSIWHTRSDTPKGFNKTGFGNAQTDGVIDSINVILDEKKRNILYREIQEIIYEEQPYVFLFVPTERIVIHKRFAAKGTALRPGYKENTFQIKGDF